MIAVTPTVVLRRFCASRMLLAALVAFVCLGLIGHSAAAAGAPSDKRHVLILNSYDPAYGWTANIVQGAQSVFDKMDDVAISIEFMDTKKVFTPEYADLLSQIYAKKYGSMHFDLILSSDDDALDFLKRYRDELFPGVPVVFCGVNDFQDGRIAGFPNVTGVNEQQDYDENVEFVARLRPQTKELVFLIDKSATGVAGLRQVEALEPRWRGRFKFRVISNVTFGELENQVAGLSDDAVVFWSMFMRDRANVPLSMRESHKLVVSASQVPVFGFSDVAIKYGAAGGYVVSGFTQGETAARLGARVLAGERADDIPVVRQSPNVYMLDYPSFKRWKLDPERVPPDAVVLNRPFSFYERYRSYVWAALGGMGTESLVIVALIGAIRTVTRKSRAKLRESEERYRSIVEDGTELICRFDRGGNVLFANGALARISTKPQPELVGRSFWSLLTEETDTASEREVGSLSKQYPVIAMEQASLSPEGDRRWILWTYRGLFGADGQLVEIQAVGHDITARREAELAVHAALEEVEQGHAELARANENLQGVLDSMREGLVVCDRDGVLTGTQSKTAVTWFGPSSAGLRLWDYLFEEQSEQKSTFQAAFDQLTEDFLPFELSVAQFPKRFTRGDRTYGVNCHQVIRDADFAGMVFTIADITLELEQEQIQNLNRELPAIVGNLLRDRDGFQEFVEETEQLLARMAAVTNRAERRRLLHTLKGNTAIYGFDSFASSCHAMEDAMEMDECEPTRESIEALAREWNGALGRFSVFLGHEETFAVQLALGDYEDLLRRLEAREDHAEILLLARRWVNPPMSQILGIHARTIRQLARRFEKEVEPRIIDHALRLPSAELRGLMTVLVHVVRNAVDHGLESPDEREHSGKARMGHISIESRIEDSEFIIVVEDDGRGIDWDAVRQRAQERGLPAVTGEDLVDALFADGLTTRDVVSDVSGRGVGLGSVRQTCQQLGGHIRVTSQKGRGTRFEFRFAMSSLVRDSEPAARPASGGFAAA
jgi:PAS domain S-box-containing protein